MAVFAQARLLGSSRDSCVFCCTTWVWAEGTTLERTCQCCCFSQHPSSVEAAADKNRYWYKMHKCTESNVDLMSTWIKPITSTLHQQQYVFCMGKWGNKFESSERHFFSGVRGWGRGWWCWRSFWWMQQRDREIVFSREANLPKTCAFVAAVVMMDSFCRTGKNLIQNWKRIWIRFWTCDRSHRYNWSRFLLCNSYNSLMLSYLVLLAWDHGI